MSDEQKPDEPNFESVEEFLKSISPKEEGEPRTGPASTSELIDQWMKAQQHRDSAIEDVNQAMKGVSIPEGGLTLQVDQGKEVYLDPQGRLMLHFLNKKLDHIIHAQDSAALLFAVLLREIRELRRD